MALSVIYVKSTSFKIIVLVILIQWCNLKTLKNIFNLDYSFIN